MIDAGTRQRELLITTTTGEPMQPARLYYRIAGGRRAAVVRILGTLKCVERVPGGPPRWGWWHAKEAARLDFSRFAESARPSPDTIVLGIIDMREPDAMEITVRSLHRAVLAARFFGCRLGERVSLVRVRVLNRLLTEEDLHDGVDAVDDLLDGDVTMVDPREAQARWEMALARRGSDGVRSLEDLEGVARELLEDDRPDVPLLEDLPLAPEAETPSYSDLDLLLQLRMQRALAHRLGQTDVTVRSIIRDVAARFAAGPAATIAGARG